MIWKDIPGYPGYQVSDAGQVRVLAHTAVREGYARSEAVPVYERMLKVRNGRVRIQTHTFTVSELVQKVFGTPLHTCRYLTSVQRGKIADLLKQKVRVNDICRRYGCSNATVYNIKKMNGL